MNESLVPIRLRKSRALERDEGRIPFETRKKKKKAGKCEKSVWGSWTENYGKKKNSKNRYILATVNLPT